MAFVKTIKNKPYFKRYQVKYRRRREGLTDYRARRRLVQQDKNKYNSPRYRFVVRISNKTVTTQIVRARIGGDEVVTAAYSSELKAYGFPVQSANYAAAYATGLLCARRILAKFNLADKYAGQATPTGADYSVAPLADGPAPFFALLDVGLARTTTGARIFAALKGATDGGIEIPHSPSRFVGYDSEKKVLAQDVLRKYIFGGHVADYMKTLKEEDEERYAVQFSALTKAGITADNMEETWKKVHAAIRKDPVKKAAKAKTAEQKKAFKSFKRQPLSLAQRRDRVKQKLASKAKKAQA